MSVTQLSSLFFLLFIFPSSFHPCLLLVRKRKRCATITVSGSYRVRRCNGDVTVEESEEEEEKVEEEEEEKVEEEEEEKVEG